MWNPESAIFLDIESAILGFGTRIPDQGIWDHPLTTGIWNQIPRNPQSTTWNPKFKTVLKPYIGRELLKVKTLFSDRLTKFRKSFPLTFIVKISIKLSPLQSACDYFAMKVPEIVIFIYEPHSTITVNAVNTVGNLIEYLTIIPRVRVGYELAIIISYPTSASGIIVLLKTPTKYREFFPTLFVKTTYFQLGFKIEQTRTATIFGEHGIINNYSLKSR